MDEQMARNRCKAAGLNPDFVGTKGYPNWKDFTDDKLAETERTLADAREFFRLS